MRALLVLLLLAGSALAETYDVVVYGATPAGIMSAVAARREGAKVLLLEPTPWIGGMVAGGLSSSDLGNPATIGGLALEFFNRCGAKYPPEQQKLNGKEQKWYSEPHVYQQVFREMLQEVEVAPRVQQVLKKVERQGARIVAIEIGQAGTAPERVEGRVFIDASYEGDLMAQAGVSAFTGRESTQQYGEPLAGFRLEEIRNFPPEVMTQGCACVGGNGPHYVHGAPTRINARKADGTLLPGVVEAKAAPGSGDALTQSYNFRICVTDQPGNRVPWPKPARYEAERYELLLRLIQAYPGMPFSRLVHLGRIANNKFDLNAQGLFSTDYVGGNKDYPGATPLQRTAIRQDHLDQIQGMFWFLTHDERVPAALREEAAKYSPAKDEFTDNGHWPYALYVREARRMQGEYVLTQKDVQRDILKPDSVGMGSFIIDSHIVQRVVSEDGVVLDEGAFDAFARPYHMPYRSLTPKRAECENLLVPVCLSASHVAYCSLRMEPVYMAMGHASGVAAAMAVKAQSPVQTVDVPALQAKLKAQHQVLALASLTKLILPDELPGVVQDDEQAKYTGAWMSTNFGSPIGGGSRHDGDAGKGTKRARFELTVPKAGKYEVRLAYTPSNNRADKVPVAIEHTGGTFRTTVNQQKLSNPADNFQSLGTFEFQPGKPAVVEVSNEGTKGFVSVDAVQLLPAK